MKSLPLRELLRHPKTIKKLTAAGHAVRITDNGKPLWVVSAASSEGALEDDEGEAERLKAIDAALDHLLDGPLPPSDVPSLSKIFRLSRGSF